MGTLRSKKMTIPAFAAKAKLRHRNLAEKPLAVYPITRKKLEELRMPSSVATSLVKQANLQKHFWTFSNSLRSGSWP
jgi:hypothetical protein